MDPEKLLSTPVKMQAMSWQEIKPLAGPNTVVVVPTGAIEQHGPHLPLEVDCLIATAVAERAAAKAVEKVPVLVAPTLSLGVSGYHMSWPGTVTLSSSTYIRVVEEVCASLIHHGFRRILLLNGHGGNHDPNKIAARNVADLTGVAVASASYWTLAADKLAQFQHTEVDGVPGHACGFETSCMLALSERFVRREFERSSHEDAGLQGEFFTQSLRKDALAHLPQQAGVVQDAGWAGDPTKASAEKGERYLHLIVDRVADFVVKFGSDPLVEANYAFNHSTVHD